MHDKHASGQIYRSQLDDNAGYSLSVSFVLYPRVIAVVRCLSVSVTSRSSLETVGQITLGFGTAAYSFIQSCSALRVLYLKRKITSFWNFVQNSGLHHATSFVAVCHQLSRTQVHARTINCRRLMSVELTLKLVQLVEQQIHNKWM